MNNTLSRLIAVLISIPFLFALASCFEDAAEPDTTAPTIYLNFPAVGDTVGSETLLSAAAKDDGGIASVRFYVEDVMIAEDNTSPFEQVWFSGFWEDAREYSIRVEAEDKAGNISSTDTVSLYVADDSRFIPEILQPAVATPVPYSDVTYRWNPVPGARGYILRIVIPEYGIDQSMCYDAGHETCFLHVPGTEYTADLPLPAGLTGDGTLDVIADVSAWWDNYHASYWSEEIRFQARLPEEPPPLVLQQILEGIDLHIRETYNGGWKTWYVVTEPKITILLETDHIFPYHNVYIEHDCTLTGDTIQVVITGTGSPPVSQPALGPAHGDVFIYPEPGQYTLLLKCHDATDVFSIVVTDSSIYYEQEVHEFVISETELVWRHRENTFSCQWTTYHPSDDWIIEAFHDSLLSLGCEEFIFPDEGIFPYTPYDFSDPRFYRYNDEDDYIAVGEMLDRFVNDPVYTDGDFRINLHNWKNVIYDSYTF